VTQAIRDATSSRGAIHEGDWLGLSRSGIEVVETTFLAAATALVEKLLGDDHEIVTLIEGSGADREVIDEIAGYVAASHPEVAVERHLGNQPLYPLLISIE
jgi:dihydroxyacetone kinase-like predicted kinase